MSSSDESITPPFLEILTDSSSDGSDSPPRARGPVTVVSLPPLDDHDGWNKLLEANWASYRKCNHRYDVAVWADDAVKSGDKCSPPLDWIVMHPDLLERAWGWDRLVVFKGDVGWPIYTNYLKEYYSHNNLEYVAAAAGQNQNPREWPLKSAPQVPVNGNGNGSGLTLTAVAKFCLEMEEPVMSELKKQEKRGTPETIILITLIQQRVRLMMKDEFSPPAAAALLCIAKEADLMSELLRHPAEDTDGLIETCDCIRMCALSLMNCKGCESVAAAAAMVGIAKETKLICEWMRTKNEVIDDSDPSVPCEIAELYSVRAKMFQVMFRVLEDSSSSSAAADVHNPYKVESGIAATEAAESAGLKSSGKSDCQPDKKKSMKKETKRQMTEKFATTKKSRRNNH